MKNTGEKLRKLLKVFHVGATILAWGILALGLVRMMAAYPSLPETVGMHFGPNGEFDLFGNKTDTFTLFYPCIVSLVVLVVLEVFAFVSKRVKPGLNVNETGERMIRESVVILLDVLKWIFSFFYAGVWVDCVIRQHALNTTIPVVLVDVAICLFAMCVMFSIAVRIKCPKENNQL